MADFCCVCDDGCEAPAGYGSRGGWAPGHQRTRKKCFACGLHVCSKCSTIMKWFRYKRKRICNNCKQDQGKQNA